MTGMTQRPSGSPVTPDEFGLDGVLKVAGLSIAVKTRQVHSEPDHEYIVLVDKSEDRVHRLAEVKTQRTAAIQWAMRHEQLVQALLPEEPPAVPDETTVLMARRNAQARQDLLAEFGYLRAEQIAEGRSTAANQRALASRWAREGKIFAVDWHSQRLYPRFQFAEDRSPLPAIASVLRALPRAEMSDWEVALWWTAANGWLGGQRPVDALRQAAPEDDHPAVVEAAGHLADPSPW
jgi:hypothetical protein